MLKNRATRIVRIRGAQNHTPLPGFFMINLLGLQADAL
jgi:hypothetical protein